MAWHDLQNTDEIARLVTSGDLEDAAYAISQKSVGEIEDLIRAIVSHIIQAPPIERESETDLLAWLLSYEVIDPVLLLQVLVVTRKYSILSICGTTHFGEDKMKQFRLSHCSGKPLKYPVDTERAKVNVNFKEYLITSRKRPSQPIATNNKDVKPAKVLKPTEAIPESNEYTRQIRRLLLSSMSASEAVFRINKAFKRGSELQVAATVLRTCYESVTYNQLFGQVAVLLSQDNLAWHGAFTALFKQFVNSEECDELGVDELQVCGSFFAHLLGTGTIVWSEAIGAIELDEDPDHASLRIFVMAILKELKLGLGLEAVTKKVLDPAIEKQISGILYTPIAPWFWEVAGFDSIAAQLHRKLDDKEL